MAMYAEQFIPGLRENGLTGDFNISTTGTLASGAQTVTGAVSATSTLTAVNAGASTSGGNTTPAVTFGSGGMGIYFGSGAPTISAIKGSLYLNFTGSSSSTRLYVNNGTTTWVAVTTAS